jgi:hypothetical protein
LEDAPDVRNESAMAISLQTGVRSIGYAKPDAVKEGTDVVQPTGIRTQGISNDRRCKRCGAPGFGV